MLVSFANSQRLVDGHAAVEERAVAIQTVSARKAVVVVPCSEGIVPLCASAASISAAPATMPFFASDRRSTAMDKRRWLRLAARQFRTEHVPFFGVRCGARHERKLDGDGSVCAAGPRERAGLYSKSLLPQDQDPALLFVPMKQAARKDSDDPRIRTRLRKYRGPAVLSAGRARVAVATTKGAAEAAALLAALVDDGSVQDSVIVNHDDDADEARIEGENVVCELFRPLPG
ncbi:hypothetical protein SPI_09358 [Niveomyces insectorum RCEF 264]|uniref:Uncharacterized protein n=1 Tax=Niveomyces insectorum RCEF 264 TaxID=1081102 RepID=A0A167LXP4_9HYPO|nr:hypothetical protein SPI_09358 [Niveomyces insectorum RCEF 264]